MSQGWIKLHRQIQDNPIWTAEAFTRGQAWVDLLLLANHESGYIYVRNHKIEIKRGQVGWSQNRLAKRWQWSRTKVRKFLQDLEKEQQIKQEKSKSYTVIALINYDQYQEKKQQKNNSSTTEKQQEDTNKNVKNDNNVKKYTYGDPEKRDKDQPINHQSFIEAFNELYDRQLRVTDKKREMIRARLRTYTGKEISEAWKNRKKSKFLNGEGSKYMGDWAAAMRNDEKIDNYLNLQREEMISYNGLDNNIMRKYAKNG